MSIDASDPAPLSFFRVGLVGAGIVGARRADLVHSDPRARLVSVADIDLERARQVADQSGIPGCRISANWHDVTDDSTVDVVIVSTFHKFLAPVTIAALDAGKHVLCEKPLGQNLEQARSMVTAARASNRLLKVGFNHRYHPALRQAHQLLAEGAIGEPMFIRAVYGHGGRPDYAREWRMDPDLGGGGHLVEHAVHLIDLSRWFLGEFSRVFAYAPSYYYPTPLEDNVFASLWTEKGQIAQLHSSATQWRNRFEFEIFGKDGFLSAQGLGKSYGLEKLTLGKRLPQHGPPDETTWEFPGGDISWRDEWFDFTHALRTGQRPLGNSDDGLAAMVLVDSLYRSARANLPVQVL